MLKLWATAYHFKKVSVNCMYADARILIFDLNSTELLSFCGEKHERKYKQTRYKETKYKQSARNKMK